jgi:integrase
MEYWFTWGKYAQNREGERKMSKTDNIYKNLEKQVNRIYKHSRQGSFKTRERYFEGTKRFCRFLSEKYKLQKFANVQDKHVKTYIEHMQQEGKSASTVKTDLAGIRYFHEQSGAKRELSGNEKFELDKRKFGGVDRSWTEKEYQGMIDHARNLGQERIADAMTLAREQGLRIHEVFRIDRAAAENSIRTGQLHVKGKGGLERDVPVSNQAKKVLQKQMDQTERGQKLFVEHGEKTHLVIKQTQNWIVRHRNKFSDSPITFHGLRHTFAREEYQKRITEGMTEHNARLEVSELLGHHRDDVTRIYLAQ